MTEDGARAWRMFLAEGRTPRRAVRGCPDRVTVAAVIISAPGSRRHHPSAQHQICTERSSFVSIDGPAERVPIAAPSTYSSTSLEVGLSLAYLQGRLPASVLVRLLLCKVRRASP